MKKYFLILFGFYLSIGFSQKEAKWSHALAGGASYCLDQTTSAGHDEDWIKYKNPGYVFFYRLIEEKNDVLNIITLNANYRNGSLYSTTGGLGGSSTTNGTFGWCRMDLGFTILGKVGKTGNFCLGPGIYAGGLVFANGNGEHSESSIGNAGSNEKVNAFKVLNRGHIGVNIELQQKIELNENEALLLGLRIGLETPDGLNLSRFTKLGSGYIGYQFSKKKKIKSTEVNSTDK